MAVGSRAHHGAAVHAAVQEHDHALVAGAREDDGLPAQGARDEVARAWDLALVAHEHPAPMEDPLHLVVEDARIAIERSMDAVAFHERRVVNGRGGHFAHGAVV